MGEYDYLSLYYDYPDPIALLLLFLLAMMRFAPIVVLAPFFGAKLVPGPVRVGIVVMLAVTFLPHLLMLTKTPLQFDLAYLGLIAKELFIGLVLGFLVSIPFFIANTSGILIDHQRGSSSMMQTDPTMQIQASPIGQLYNYVLIFMFFSVGGPFYFLDSVSLSYEMIPPATWISPNFFLDGDSPFWKQFIDLGNVILAIGTQLAAPALVAILMSDLFLGIANRMAQQVPMAFLGWALKSLVGMAILWIAWYFILEQLQIQTADWLHNINHVIYQLQPA